MKTQVPFKRITRNLLNPLLDALEAIERQRIEVSVIPDNDEEQLSASVTLKVNRWPVTMGDAHGAVVSILRAKVDYFNAKSKEQYVADGLTIALADGSEVPAPKKTAVKKAAPKKAAAKKATSRKRNDESGSEEA